MQKALTAMAAAAALCCGCQKTCEPFEPNISYNPSPCLFEGRESAFPSLSAKERASDWGKQLRIAYAFTREQDYYRAITAFKSALVFLPPGQIDRKQQMEFGVVESYYLGNKYQETVEAFEASSLISCSNEFPPYRDLLIMIYDSYLKSCREEKAAKLLELIYFEFPDLGNDIELSTAFLEADIPAIESLVENRPDSCDYYEFINEYATLAKSEKRAQIYQALLPGAGYYYVGQKDAARTSLIINALFTWAAYRFFDKGYFAAGLITASLEAGWYLGGINGARLAAKEYNERLWGANGREFMLSHQMFPVLMFETTF